MRFGVFEVGRVLLVSMCLVAAAIAEGQMLHFEKSECPFENGESLEGVECGYVTVQENRDHPNGRTLRLAVAILRSSSTSPDPDPLVFLSGGPGERSVAHTPLRVKRPFWQKLRERRDLIFFDQRGTGYSEPTFCPELSEIYTASFRGLSTPERFAFQTHRLRACREKLSKQGLDFSAYNSRASAYDLEDIRSALGYRTWNVLGVSYGTRLALTAMRDTPQALRSVVLDSTSPPNVRNWVDAPASFARSLRLLFDQCNADTKCKQTYPDLEQDFYQLLQDLQKEPIVLTGLDDRFPEGRLVVDGTLFAAGIFQGLYDRRFIPLIPLVISEMKNRNIDVLRAMAEGLVHEPELISFGLFYSVDCYEIAPFNPLSEIELEQARHPELRLWYEFVVDHALCKAWHDVRADATESLPVKSDIPTFVLGGEFDPITPPSYGRVAASTLSNSTFVEIKAAGHAVSPSSECTQGLLSTFLANPSKQLDTSCVKALKPLAFVTDVRLNPGVYRVASNFQPEPKVGRLAGLGLMAILQLSALILWPSAFAISRLRKRAAKFSKTQRVARVLAGIASLFALAFLTLLAVMFLRLGSENPYLIAFGLPASVSWIFLLPWFVVLVAPVNAFMALLAWKRRWWKLAARIHYSLIVAACAAFAVSMFLLKLIP